MSSKKYPREVLEVLTRPESLAKFFDHHAIDERGVWVRKAEDWVSQGLGGSEVDMVTWTPHKTHTRPALPFPFSAAELAAFMWSGMGSDLHEAFIALPDADGMAPDLVGELRRSGQNDAVEAAEAMTTAMQLWSEAASRFNRASDDEADDGARWLLSQDAMEDVAAPPTTAAVVESKEARQDRRLNQFKALGGAVVRHENKWVLRRTGALADLSRSETASGRTRHDPRDVSKDIKAAAERQRVAAALPRSKP